jgi:glycosyltransferase involved in cell wall biosynthesis
MKVTDKKNHNIIKNKTSGNSVSAVIITHNEEHNIKEALKSVSWADEIVVVDSGSNDRTVEFAKKTGAKTFRREWKGYIDQKSWADSKAISEWILSIDADERVSQELKMEILSLMKSGTGKNGYYIPRRAIFLGRKIRHCHWYPDYQMRLFRKKKATWKGGLVHERIEVKGETGKLKRDLIHYTYKDIADQTDKLNKYSTLWATDAFKKGRKAGIASVILSPAATFLNVYFFRLGLLDGFPGFVISRGLAYYSFQKKAKLYQLNRNKKQK